MIERIFSPLRRLKDWTEGFAPKPHAEWVLFLIAFAESSFFPIPPDVLLIALGVFLPKKAFRFALISAVGSVLGGLFGYYIGYALFEAIGKPIIDFYGVQQGYEEVRRLYQENAFAAIAIAGFTPIPYKVFTIAAGAFEIDVLTLVFASALSRSARFFLVSSLFYFFGPTVKRYIDKYFEAFTVAFVILLVLGFVVIRYLI